MEEVLAHETRNELVETVARSSMVIAIREQIIVLAVVEVGTNFEISKM